MPSLRAVIFDLDGTLTDTEAVWTEGLRRWLSTYGKTYEPSFQKNLMGKPGEVSVKLLADHYGIEGDWKKLLVERDHAFEIVLRERGFVEKSGACALIRALTDAGLKIGLATSADRPYAEAALKALECRECFSTVTCGEDIEHGKPAPDIYLAAAKKLGVSPDEAIAFEDAPAGVLSAKAAGMKVVGIFDPRYNDALPGADLQVDSLRKVTVPQLRKFFS